MVVPTFSDNTVYHHRPTILPDPGQAPGDVVLLERPVPSQLLHFPTGCLGYLGEVGDAVVGVQLVLAVLLLLGNLVKVRLAPRRTNNLVDGLVQIVIAGFVSTFCKGK